MDAKNVFASYISVSLTHECIYLTLLFSNAGPCKAPLMRAEESSVIVSLYLVIRLAQFRLTDPFQAG